MVIQKSHVAGVVTNIGHNNDVQNFIEVETDGERANVKFVHIVEVFVSVGDRIEVGTDIGYFE